MDDAFGTPKPADSPACDDNHEDGQTPKQEPKPAEFTAKKSKKRKPGNGYVKQITANCWQGRYTPTVNGKRIARNVYAPTEEECEVKLTELIKEMKAEFGIK